MHAVAHGDRQSVAKFGAIGQLKQLLSKLEKITRAAVVLVTILTTSATFHKLLRGKVDGNAVA